MSASDYISHHRTVVNVMSDSKKTEFQGGDKVILSPMILAITNIVGASWI
jgi:hypothetical protein